jgi:putative flippase GtrA
MARLPAPSVLDLSRLDDEPSSRHQRGSGDICDERQGQSRDGGPYRLLSAPRYLMARGTLVFRYVAFAICATAANIVAQMASLIVYDGQHAFQVSVLLGTGVGFFLKYVLDKYLVFADATQLPAAELRKIFAYGLTAVVTTLIFWSIEAGAWMIWKTSFAKYAGAVIGLSIGYVVKYRLDRQYIFMRNPLS